MSGEVIRLISAPWCKRCHVIKPEVTKVCALVGASLTVVDFDDMTEAEKSTITSLPTILMGDMSFTASDLEAWKTLIMSKSMTITDTDF